MNAYKILLTEDDPDIRELVHYDIQRILGENCDVDLAVNGTQAINLIKESEYDVILLDYHLPDINGKIVRDQSNTDSPFVFISGDFNIHQECDGKKSFALEKPFRSEELEKILKMTLKGKSLIN